MGELNNTKEALASIKLQGKLSYGPRLTPTKLKTHTHSALQLKGEVS